MVTFSGTRDGRDEGRMRGGTETRDGGRPGRGTEAGRNEGRSGGPGRGTDAGGDGGGAGVAARGGRREGGAARGTARWWRGDGAPRGWERRRAGGYKGVIAYRLGAALTAEYVAARPPGPPPALTEGGGSCDGARVARVRVQIAAIIGVHNLIVNIS